MRMNNYALMVAHVVCQQPQEHNRAQKSNTTASYNSLATIPMTVSDYLHKIPPIPWLWLNMKKPRGSAPLHSLIKKIKST